MKPSDIKVGLRVKFINNNYSQVGKIATIIKVQEGSPKYDTFNVKWDDDNRSYSTAWYCYNVEERFDLYNPDDLS